MPLYDYRCPQGHKREVMLRLADINSPVFCQCDGSKMERQVSAPMVIGDYPGYECPVSGAWIEGRKAHQENLKRTGCRILEPGETDNNKRQLERENEALDQRLEATADEFIAKLPTEKRDRLAAEMEGGLTATIERSTPSL
jgi:putative FmdB family regulatory protein